MVKILAIDGNALADSIPTEIGQCSQLESLQLNGNLLTGYNIIVAFRNSLIDGKRFQQLTEMRWQVRFPRKLGSALG